MAPANTELKRWISDSLTSLGGSDPIIVDYVLATANSSASHSQLFSKLGDYLEAPEDQIKRFAEDLYRRSNSGSAGPDASLSLAPATTHSRAPKRKYAFLPAEEESTMSTEKPKKREKKERDKKDRKDRHREMKRRRTPSEERWRSQSESEEEAVQQSEEEEELEPEPEPEPERETNGSRTPEPQEAPKKSQPKESINMADVRLKSRQDYLRKREAEKLALLEKQVEEEMQEEKEHGHELTEKELLSFRANRQNLEAIKARLLAGANAEDQKSGFFIDEGQISRVETLKRKTRDVNDGLSEVALWEQEQTRRAQATATLRTDNRLDADDYELVFDESQAPAFTTGGSIPGTMSREMAVLMEKIDIAEAKQNTMQEQRKKLPLYTYREELVQAIKDHQCLIVSSETGSGKTTVRDPILFPS
jgi:pre-mRNA-splicing factor ATP-dependent RNA helicase DHX16